jgi:Protein NO VEIN, C-terminal
LPNKPVLNVWVSASANGRRNLLHGLETQTWGFKTNDTAYEQPNRWLLFGYNHSNGSPRVEPPMWQAGTFDLVLCELTTPLYRGSAPHWPDEIERGGVIYPYRIGFTPVATLTAVTASPSGPLGADGTEGMRVAAISSRGVSVNLDVAPLLQLAGITPPHQGSHTDLSGTTIGLPAIPRVRGRRGAGRSQDPAFNRAVEDHAVRMAIAHMTKLEWPEIESLGKPFDLVCRRPSGEEKHVEVKGTTGSGADVEYTSNEVAHFRSCPHGADLIVVRDIGVDRSERPYLTSGGQLLHVENYRAPHRDLQPTRWRGRVPGWEQATDVAP